MSTGGKPALAFALANNNDFRHTSIDAAGFQAAAYSLRKQRWIQEWLGYPGSKAAEKLLRKIPVDSVSLPLLRRLKYAMQSDPKALELLGHQRVINTSVLQMVTHDTILPYISPQLLEAASNVTCREGERTLGDQILDIVTMRQKIAPGQPTQVFHPITSYIDLQIEGKKQNNCVATYLRAVKLGGIYFYRVTEPERATLLIFRGTDGCWRRSQLRCYSNRKPKRATVNAVDRWLAQYNHSV